MIVGGVGGRGGARVGGRGLVGRGGDRWDVRYRGMMMTSNGLDWIGEMVSSCIYCDGDDGLGCIGFWVMHDA
jgi:hypothetical protein